MNAQEVTYGVKGGLNVAKLIGGEKGFDARGGFHIGGFVEIKISEKFYIQPELLFSQQGTKGTFTEFDGWQIYELEVTAKYDYLNIPIMGKFAVTKEFSLLAGPQIGFLISAKQKVEVESTSLEIDVKDGLKKLDLGINFGAGYDFTNNLFAEVRYNLGLREIGKEAEVLVGKNGVIQISIGYKF